MNCKNCGMNIIPGDKYCRTCGTTLNMNDEQNPLPQNYQNLNNSITDEMLVDAYMGPKAENFKKGNFSACTFCFGVVYVLYRKMWLLGIVLFFLNIILLLVDPTASVASFCCNVFIAIKFKKWYYKHAQEQVQKIKQNNINLPPEQLTLLCQKKGGITIIPILIYITLICMLLLYIIGIAINEKSNPGRDKQGKIYLYKLSLEIPENFEDDSYNEESYIYDYMTTNDSCSVSVTSKIAKTYDTEETHLRENVYTAVGSNVSDMTTKLINGNNWTYMTIENVDETYEYYYVIIKDNKLYEVTYEIMDDSGECSAAQDKIINSLTFTDGEQNG